MTQDLIIYRTFFGNPSALEMVGFCPTPQTRTTVTTLCGRNTTFSAFSL